MKKTSSTISLSNWLAATYNGFKEGPNWMNWRFLFGDQTSVISPWVTWSLNLIQMRVFSRITMIHKWWDFLEKRYLSYQTSWLPRYLCGNTHQTHGWELNGETLVKLLNYRWRLWHLCHFWSSLQCNKCCMIWRKNTGKTHASFVFPHPHQTHYAHCDRILVKLSLNLNSYGSYKGQKTKRQTSWHACKIRQQSKTNLSKSCCMSSAPFQIHFISLAVCLTPINQSSC